jgi:putative endonuclease
MSASLPAPDPPPPGTAIGSAAGHGNDARRALAAAGEAFAVQHLQRLGYEIVARNHRTRFGELDVVASDRKTLVFAEIKTRRASAGADPWRSLHERKRAQVRRMAAAYLAEVADRPRGLDLRFDAIAVAIDPRGRLVSIDHLEGAF